MTAASDQAIRVEPVAVERILALRHTVLRQGLPAEMASFEGDAEPTTLHLAALQGQAVVGCATLVRRTGEDGAAWQLRGMAVSPGCRGRGVGAALLAEVHRRAASAGVWCNARLPAVGFYERHGWRCVSERFDVPTAGPHRRMVGPDAAAI